MEATVFVLGLVVALAAAVRSTWSPCGQSMLSQLTPVGEASRGYRYRTTAIWFVLGAVVGGATIGAVMAALAAAVSAIGATSTALLGIAAGLAVLGATVDSGVLGFMPPFFKRQVNEYWLSKYRAWVYGSGFGWQIGAGVTTYIMTTAVFVTDRVRRAHRGPRRRDGARRRASASPAGSRCCSPPAAAARPICSRCTVASTRWVSRCGAR